MSVLDPVVNFGKITVSTGYDDTDTAIIVTSGGVAILPSSGNFNLVWYNWTDYNDPTDDPNREIIRITNITSNTLTVTRAQESTIASNKNDSGKTYKMILTPTKKMIDDINTNLTGSLSSIGEEPIGVKDNSNQVYTVANTPNGTNLVPILNGIILTRVDSATDISEFSHASDVKSFLIGEAPLATESLKVIYTYS